MTIPIVPSGPGVPNLPGVNTVAGLVGEVIADVLNLNGDISQQWGLFLDGDPVVVAESVLSFEYKRAYKISTFAVEPSNQQSAGGFESYNKVQSPFDVILRFSTGDTPAARQQLIESAEAACASLDLMDAVTPEQTYQSVNPTNFDYRRTAANGVALIVLDMYCEQVRTTASSSFTTPDQASTTSGGSTAADNIVPTSSAATAPTAVISNPTSPSAAPTISTGTSTPVPADLYTSSAVLP